MTDVTTVLGMGAREKAVLAGIRALAADGRLRADSAAAADPAGERRLTREPTAEHELPSGRSRGGANHAVHVVVHQVGHGQAAHAFTPSGHVVVIDLGCSTAFGLLEWLSSQTSTIDCLVVTHRHGDHVDEILDLDERGFRLRRLWHPKWLTETEVRRAHQTAYNAQGQLAWDISDPLS